MGKEAKPHSSEDIWHLGIEDLLGQPAEPARTTGTGPFVVVLRTSPAPITALSKRLPRFEPLQLYQPGGVGRSLRGARPRRQAL